MAMPMEQWLKENQPRFDKISLKEASHREFFRDPARPMRQDVQFMFSPADGFITTQGRFDANEDLIDVKGRDVTINSLLGPQLAIDSPALVICVFMSFLDVHINRTPTACTMTSFPLPPIQTGNVPMLWTERGILEKYKILKDTLPNYMRDNGRVVNKCFCPYLNYWYYVVQIADSDVSCIVPFHRNRTETFTGCQRFGMIRWGSMCSLVLPIDKRFKFKPLVPLMWHCEAGNDTLVSVQRVG